MIFVIGDVRGDFAGIERKSTNYCRTIYLCGSLSLTNNLYQEKSHYLAIIADPPESGKGR